MKRSVFLKIAVGFLVTYTVSIVVFFVHNLATSYDMMKQKSYQSASNYLNIGEILLQVGNVEDLSFRLDDALAANDIHYYLIRKDGEDIVFSSAAGVDDPIVFAESDVDGEFDRGDYRHHVIHEGPYYLAVGYKTSLWSYAKIFTETNGPRVMKEIVFVCIFGLALVVFAFRDLLAVLRGFKKRGASRSAVAVAKSKETLTLIQGLKGYEQKQATLAKENSLLKGQVLPALQNELRIGKTPPYEFGCTLVRTDINNFTTVFSTQNRAQFMEVINEFFVGVAHIASRYQGYVYEFIGDEVLFYFKDDDHANSAAIGLSAIRDINALAEKFNERCERDYGYSFRIKSSLSWGMLRFGPLVNGFSLAGIPLIETVRMLSHIHEKSANTVLFDDAVYERTATLCASQEHGVVMLKGLSTQRRLHVYQSHVPMLHHLKQGKSESVALATLYRSNSDICEILDYVDKNFDDLSQESALQLLSIFRNYSVTEDSAEIRQAYVSLLESLLERGLENEKSQFALASVVTAAAHLFPSEAFKGRLRDTLLKCLEIENRRVLANTLDVFAALDPEASESVFARFTAHNDNRIAANAIVLQAKRDWNRSTMKSLKALMKGRSAFQKASALYALGEIAKHLKSTDEVAYQADLDLQGLVTNGIAMIGHANKMVRRQAMGLAKKADRANDLLDFSVSPEVRAEIDIALGGIPDAEDLRRNKAS